MTKSDIHSLNMAIGLAKLLCLPHEMERHIVLSSVICPFVCLFVTLSCCSISFEPLVGFTNNSAQISSMMSGCAVHMFNQGHFKIMFIVQGHTLYPVRSTSFEPHVGFRNNSAQISSMKGDMCSADV